MDAQLAREFRERWQAVEVVEAEEERAASLEMRWVQLNAIWRMARELRLPLTNTDRQEEAVRRRWLRLKGVKD